MNKNAPDNVSAQRITESPGDTESIAFDFAQSLKGGECIALHGDLGAGKTCFVRGLVRGLGGADHSVSSPTYVLLNVYTTPKLMVYHLDAYRIRGEDDFEAIGFPELLEQEGVVIVEWAERIKKLLPAKRIDIRFEHLEGDQRRISISDKKN